MARERTIRILRETEHYVFLAPPSEKTMLSEVLDEIEFIRAAGDRPLFPIFGFGIEPEANGYVCEKSEPPQ